MAVKDRKRPAREVPEELQARLDALVDMVRRMIASWPEFSERLRGILQERNDRSLHDVAEQHHVPEDAIESFAAKAGELLEGRPLSNAAAERGALWAVANEVWENELGPLCSTAEIREMLGGVSRQRVDELWRHHRLISLLDSAGRRRFPLFQFGDGRPLESLVSAFWTLAAAPVNEWTAASWCVRPDAERLEGLSPVRWAAEGRDPERLNRLAWRDAERLSH
jgi:hypothetical protein